MFRRPLVPAALLLVPAALLLSVLPSVASAQREVGPSTPDLPIELQLAAGFLFTLLVGGLLLGVAPDYVDRIIGVVRREPGAAFVWGIGVFALFIGLAVLPAITVVGVIVLVPMAFGFVVVAIAANTIAYIALVDGVVERRGVALVAAAAISGVLSAIPLLGDLVGFLVGSAGIGAIAIDYRR